MKEPAIARPVGLGRSEAERIRMKPTIRETEAGREARLADHAEHVDSEIYKMRFVRSLFD